MSIKTCAVMVDTLFSVVLSVCWLHVNALVPTDGQDVSIIFFEEVCGGEMWIF